MADETTEESGEIKTSFRFDLTTEFNYARGGDEGSAQFIEISAPTSRNLKECGRIKQAFYRALGEESGDGTETDTSPDTGGKKIGDLKASQIISILAFATTVEYADVLDVARKLFTSGLCQVEGETRLTSVLCDKISGDDFEMMLGEWIRNFTLPSLARAMKDKLSPD